MEIYSGCENTFIICMYQSQKDHAAYAQMVCKNKIDGFMMVKTTPLEMVLYNQDGSLASMCGNGIRCFIEYCYRHHIIQEEENMVLTPSGRIDTKIVNLSPFMVYVRMNEPIFTYIDNRIYLDEPIFVNNHIYKISLVHTGVWHGIILPDDFKQALEDAPLIRNLPLFKEYLNLDIIMITNDIYVKTYERGVGFTKACGTGVMASFVILEKLKLLTCNQIAVRTDGGYIEAGRNEKGLYILGPSRYVSSYKDGE